MEYEVLIKILGILASSVALSRVIIRFIERHDRKKIIRKVGEIELTLQGYSSSEAENIIRNLPEIKNDLNQKNLKSERRANIKLIKE